MKSISGKQLARVLERKGWQLIRVQGSHHIYTKPGESVRISIPIHGNKDLKVGLLRHFMKQANLSESDLQEFLWILVLHDVYEKYSLIKNKYDLAVVAQ